MIDAMAGKKRAKRSTVERFALPDGFEDGWVLTVGHHVVVGNREPAGTLWIDVAQWPPKVTKLRGLFVHSVAAAAGNRWLLAGHKGELMHRAWLYDGITITELSHREDERTSGFGGGAWHGDEMLLWAEDRYPYPYQLPAVEWRPLRRDGVDYQPLAELPAVSSSANPHVRLGRAVTGDGSEVLVYQDKGYERHGDELVATFDLGGFLTETFSSVPCGNDGFLYPRDNALYEVHRGQPPFPVVERVVIMEVTPGPQGAAILRLGENRQGDLGTIFTPGKLRHTRISRELLEVEDSESLVYIPATGRLVSTHQAFGISSVVLPDS